ncbi:cob(I)yrinic acid a,c-diamide adenosyltransferase [Oleiharenicola lentus]|uniref:cob(I)yrinic acid a,c-diamide adenosyltransferase n=1 Tax=Oleiharenicola lentus TaxID=2508720 RepID=UPI003F67FC21
MSDAASRSPRSIATRTGDDGTTSLLYGQRVAKNHPQIEAIGALDELNVAIGFAKATQPGDALKQDLEAIQQELITIMGEVSYAETDSARHASSNFAKLADAALARVDQLVAMIESRQPKFDGWATPGANLHSAALELARVAARRAERHLVGLSAHGKTIRPLILRFLNRVSDLLWLMAREAEA